MSNFFSQSIIFFAIISLGVFFVFLFYRRDSRLSKGLRIASIFILAVFLIEPFITERRRDTVAILIDTSKSMEVKQESLSFWLERIGDEDIKSEYFWFDTMLYKRDRGGGPTDIAKALELLPPHIGGVLLLSDGIYTRGQDPTTIEHPFPIYTIPIEQEVETYIRLVGYDRNYFVYKGDTVSVEAFIEARGVDGEKGWLTLFQGEKEVLKRAVIFPSDGVRTAFRLDFVPTISGIHKYRLSLKKEERISDISFPINVLERDIRVLYLSKSPSFNLKFIKDEIEEDIKFHSAIKLAEEKWLIDGIKKRGDFDVGGFIKEIDPSLIFSEGLEIPLDYIEDGGSAFLVGKGSLSPFIFGRRENRKGRMHIIEEGLFISSPPFLQFFDVIGLKRGARVIATLPGVKTALGDMPVFAAMRYGKGEIYSIASPLLVPLVFSPDREPGFFNRLIRWIVEREQEFHLTTDRVIYRLGEPIRIRMEVLQPLDQDVIVEITDGERIIRRHLYKRGERVYETVIDYLAPGRYEYSSNIGGKGEFYVEAPSQEEPTHYADRELLDRLAFLTGGKMIESPDQIQITTTSKHLKYPWFPSRLPYLLLLLIILLSVEWWSLRKGKG